jgi:hypothetical protein
MSKSKRLQILTAPPGEFLTAVVIDIFATAEMSGTQAVANLIGGNYQAVFNWRSQHTFPSNTHNLLTAALAAKGHCVAAPDTLWRMKVEANAA